MRRAKPYAFVNELQSLVGLMVMFLVSPIEANIHDLLTGMEAFSVLDQVRHQPRAICFDLCIGRALGAVAVHCSMIVLVLCTRCRPRPASWKKQ